MKRMEYYSKRYKLPGGGPSNPGLPGSGGQNEDEIDNENNKKM